ncbi:MAG: hypothetical protein ACFFCM_00795 [Promethearchaeota archaeon]
MKIASQLRGKKKFFDFDDIYKLCVSQLPNSEDEILSILNYLYQAKYLIEGVRVTKANVLENEKRKQIFEHIKNNPGEHVREIQRIFNLGSYMAFRHLKYLEKFGYLRSKKFMNRKAYFLSEFDETQDEKIILMKNERTKLIYDHIIRYEKIRLSDLERYLSLSHGQIQPHLKKLLEFDLIDTTIEGKIIYYTPKISVPTEIVTVKREFDYLGGDIRFKVAVQNNTDMSINNILITLNPSEQYFWNETVQKIPNLPPHNSRGVDFILTPNTCGTSTIFGAVSYQDAYGNAQNITINPKEIAIKCPLVIPQSMSEYEINEWMRKLKKSTTKIDYKNVSKNQAFNIAISQIEALDLSKAKYNLQNSSALFSGKVKMTGQQIVVRIAIDESNIIIEVWANELTQITGLLAYIRNFIRISLRKSLKTLEQSEEVARKIKVIFNYSNELKECFDTCCNGEKIEKITNSLSNIKNGLEKYYSDFKVLFQINKWILKFKGMYETENCIGTELAIELEYNLIEWLKALYELVTHNINVFKNTYDDFDKYLEDFKILEEILERDLEFMNKIYAMSILSYVIVIYKNNRLTLYEERLGLVETDSNLISGFMKAVQSFGTEISKKDTTIMSLKYKDYNMELKNGDYTQVILLLNGKANDYLFRCLFNFVKEFESHYEEKLKNYSGNISQFSRTREILHNAFKFPD